MPQIPSRIQSRPFGSRNPANPGRTIAPAIQARGPVLAQEQFATQDEVSVELRQSLNQVQNNARQAFAQSNGNVLALANLIQGVTLVQGGSNGASPNVITHYLAGGSASGYLILSPVGGYITAHARIASPSPRVIQVWTQFTLFSGFAACVADLLIYP